jgi:dienelactone hydrolase
MRYLNHPFVVICISLTLFTVPSIAFAQKQPGVLYVHGKKLEKVGSRTYQDYNLKKIKETFENKGFVVVAPLRESAKFSSQLRDVRTSYQKLKHSKGVDTEQLYVVGFSRGCSLAGLATAKGMVDPSGGLVLMACFPSEELGVTARVKKMRDRYELLIDLAEGISTPTVLMTNPNDITDSDTNGKALANALDAHDVKNKKISIKGSEGHQVFYDHNKGWVTQLTKFIRHKRPYKSLYQ